MLIVNDADEMKDLLPLFPPQQLWLTYVEDTSCNASQTEKIQNSIRTAVRILSSEYSIPTIRYSISSSDPQIPFSIQETPTLFVSTRNETARYSVEYSGSYHDIPNTVTHYRDWLTKWSVSRHPPHNVSSITLEESIPKFFTSLNAIWEYWNSEYRFSKPGLTPWQFVYSLPNISLCEVATRPNINATLISQERAIFERFSISLAGRRDCYFFYSQECQRHVKVYQNSQLSYEYHGDMDLRLFLVHTTSDATLTFHRETTAPIAMAHDIHIVYNALPLLEPNWCQAWKRKRPSLVCLYLPESEHRLIRMLGVNKDKIVIVDDDQRTHVQPDGMSVQEFVEETVFRRDAAPKKAIPPIESTGSIVWIEESDVGLPETGIVVAIARTCGHCQRMLAILYRLEGLLKTLGWTDRFPLYVVDVTKSDIVQPYWLPTLYYNGDECPKRSFRDETEILEWVFGQMKDSEVIALQKSM